MKHKIYSSQVLIPRVSPLNMVDDYVMESAKGRAVYELAQGIRNANLIEFRERPDIFTDGTLLCAELVAMSKSDYDAMMVILGKVGGFQILTNDGKIVKLEELL